MQRASALLLASLLAAAAAACGSASTDRLDGMVAGNGSQPSSASISPSATGADGGAAPLTTDPDKAVPFDDTAAFAWLTTECAGCHGVDSSGDPAVNASFWAMPSTMTRSFLESSTDTADVYQTLMYRYQAKSGTQPVAMPPLAGSYDQQHDADLARAIAWFRATLPLAVFDAESLYEGVTIAPSQVQGALGTLDFQCASTSTLRRFLANFTLAAYDREPLASELAAWPESALDAPVTAAQRTTILADLTSATGAASFQASGLMKLATAIGGAPGLTPKGAVTAAVATDLESEFYQLLLAKADSWPYARFFQDDTVMVTANTAPLYGADCTPPAAGTTTTPGAPAVWGACTLSAPRHGFFTTLGFLNSKPSSFLQTNNNYGRVAYLYFTLYGGMPKAATSGPTGANTPPAPDCLEATDQRSLVGASFGTAAVPEVGVLCQGCHLRKGMAAGSVLFRPFSQTGMIYDGAQLALGNDTAGDDPTLLGEAQNAVYGAPGAATQPVTPAFLVSLLSASTTSPQSCLTTGNAAAPTANFQKVGDFTDYLASNTIALATGFTNHANRAFSNSSEPTAEMILRVYSVMSNPDHTLSQLVSAYFGSDSFACDSGS